MDEIADQIVPYMSFQQQPGQERPYLSKLLYLKKQSSTNKALG